jgi:hypothetical protein
MARHFLLPVHFISEVQSLFVPEKTHCHGKCGHYVPEFINCLNFWSLFFQIYFNSHDPQNSTNQWMS